MNRWILRLTGIINFYIHCYYSVFSIQTIITVPNNSHRSYVNSFELDGSKGFILLYLGSIRCIPVTAVVSTRDSLDILEFVLLHHAICRLITM
jgi:hypothetical protein